MGAHTGVLPDGVVSADPEAWSRSYRQGTAPWDLGGPHPELEARLAADPTLGTGALGSAYVPGCGRGHDAVALANVGWRVTAVDFAGAVAPDVSAALAPLGGRFQLGDALAAAEPTDLWFDHTFFCAIDPDRRLEYGSVAAANVRPGGLLVSIVFPLGLALKQSGPPYGMSTSAVSSVLGAKFELVADEHAAQPACRRSSHRWAAWRRR